MRNEHRNIQAWIARRHRGKYHIEAEIHGQNRLPDRERHWYQPDVILRNRKGEIEYIIEVENDPMRKALVGASVLADACMKEIRQRKKPALIFFVVYMEQGIKQIPNVDGKIALVKPYCRSLRDIRALSVQEFKRLKL
jgi:hypothetical protein